VKKVLKKYGLKRMGGKRKGFTLIELLIVLTILAILVAVVTISLTTFIGKGETEACNADQKSLELASYVWHTEEGTPAQEWPTGADLIPEYIDEAPDTDTDCDWGISTAAANEGAVVYGAVPVSYTAGDCPCEDDHTAAVAGSVIVLWVAP